MNNNKQDSHSSTVATKSRRVLSGRTKKILKITGLAVLVMIIGAVVYMIFTDRIVVTIKQPSDRVVTVVTVCDDSLVDSYNEQIALSAEADTTVRDAAMASLDGISSAIAAKDNYQEDPSCVYMRFKVALQKFDHTTAQEMATTLESLSNEDRFPSMRIDGLMDIEAVKSNVAWINLDDSE